MKVLRRDEGKGYIGRTAISILLGASSMAFADPSDALEIGVGVGGLSQPILGIASEFRASHPITDWLSIRASIGYAYTFPDETIYYSSKFPNLTSHSTRLGAGVQFRHPGFKFIYAGIAPTYLIDRISNDSNAYYRFVQYNVGATVPLSAKSRIFLEAFNTQWTSISALAGIEYSLF